MGGIGPLMGGGASAGFASGLGSFDNPTLGEALIFSHDGIAGVWQPPVIAPEPLKLEDVDNLTRCSQIVRNAIVDFEMLSRLGFTAENCDGENRKMSVWHLNVLAPKGPGTVPPTTTYYPLARFVRPSVPTFVAQMSLLNNYADIRQDRLSEIMAQLGGGGAFLASVTYLQPDRTYWTLEVLAAVLRLANYVEMRVKHALGCRRAIEYTPQLQPMIQTPPHGALPSGHATESFAMALVLWTIIWQGAANKTGIYDQPIFGAQLMRTAARIAINRQVAGVHTPMESAAGAMLGLTLGQYFINRSIQTDPTDNYKAWMFDGDTYFSQPGDFNWTDLYDVTAKAQIPATPGGIPYATDITDPAATLGDPSEILQFIWHKAVLEWT
jgi:membrane-associated phospholipid phosphatase